MAQQGQVEEEIGGFVQRQRATAANHAKNSTVISTPGTYADRASMETYLLSNGYTQATLTRMNINDVKYAVRLKQDPTSI
jgi:hypothetical protein